MNIGLKNYKQHIATRGFLIQTFFLQNYLWSRAPHGTPKPWQTVNQTFLTLFLFWREFAVIYMLLYSLFYSCNRWAHKGVSSGRETRSSMMDWWWAQLMPTSLWQGEAAETDGSLPYFSVYVCACVCVCVCWQGWHNHLPDQGGVCICVSGKRQAEINGWLSVPGCLWMDYWHW